MATSVSRGTARAKPKPAQQATGFNSTPVDPKKQFSPVQNTQSAIQQLPKQNILEKVITNLNPNVIQTTSDTGKKGFIDNPNIPNAGLSTDLFMAAALGSTGGAGAAPTASKSAAASADKALTQQLQSKVGAAFSPVDQVAEMSSKLNAAVQKGSTTNSGQFQYVISNEGKVIGRVATNPKSVGLSQNLIKKSIGTKYARKGLAGAAVTLVSLGLAVNGYAEWGNIDNAKTKLGYVQTNVLKTGDPQLWAEFNQLQQEVLKEDIPAIARLLIPFYGIHSINKIEKVLAFEAKVNDQLTKDFTKAANSTSADPNDPSNFNAMRLYVASQIETNKTEEEKKRVDYYNNARLTYDKLAREAEVKARNEDAAFWRREKEKTFQREAEERQKTADFWMEYRKRVQEMGNDNAPSSLSFGLLQ